VDDRQTDSGLPPAESQEALSESHQPGSMTSEANTESTQALTTSSNGSSPRKIEANRKNAKKSTGPKTSVGKAMSSWNSTQHGLLSKRLPQTGEHHKQEFDLVLVSLQQDLEPVGTLEEVLVEKIAQEYWRLGVAAWYEAIELAKDYHFMRESIARILRYQTAINRQLFQAMNQLERLQRLRKGDQVPAPLNVQVSGSTPTFSDEEDTEQ